MWQDFLFGTEHFSWQSLTKIVGQNTDWGSMEVTGLEMIANHIPVEIFPPSMDFFLFQHHSYQIFCLFYFEPELLRLESSFNWIFFPVWNRNQIRRTSIQTEENLQQGFFSFQLLPLAISRWTDWTNMTYREGSGSIPWMGITTIRNADVKMKILAGRGWLDLKTPI
jgi:hypothetical protein